MYPPIYDNSARHNLSISSKRTNENMDTNIKLTSFFNWRRFQWYDPPQNSGPVKFFLDTSLHGLKYLGQRKRHLCERIFWFIAFTAALITSTLLIWEIVQGFITMPIVTVFSPREKTIDQVPFPAVTICNVNRIKRSLWQQYKSEAELGLLGGISNATLLKRLASVYDIYQICNSGKTFTDKFKTKPVQWNAFRKLVNSRREEFKHLEDPIGTLRNASTSCEEMIIFCLWLGKANNCTDLFQEIETDFGICCTFNMMPVSLLKRFVTNSKDNPEHVKGWAEANVNYDNLVMDHPNRTFPKQQLYAGRSAGISFMLRPDLRDYHCTSTDSDGFVVAIHLPLDFPSMRDNGNTVRSNSEVFIGVRPEVTMSAMSAKQFSLEKRGCYYDGEKKLKYYTQYTASNCLDECIARKTLEKCKCIRYFMPRVPRRYKGSEKKEPLCLPSQYECTEDVREEVIQDGLNEECSDCWPTCSEILYHKESTSLPIRKQHIDDLFESYPEMNKPGDASIVHVYFNVDSVYPRLMKEKSTIIELISNAGGLLGLCMGFSLLSLLEIVYYVTIRQLSNACRKGGGKEESQILEEQEEEERRNDLDMKNELNQLAGKKNFGFLNKMINHQSTMVQSFKDPNPNNKSDPVNEIFYRLGTRGQQHVPIVSENFLTPFEADFKRTYLATTWLQQKMS